MFFSQQDETPPLLTFVYVAHNTYVLLNNDMTSFGEAFSDDILSEYDSSK